MTTRAIFNHFNSVNEQKLLNNLTIESIQVNGIDVQYVPRTLVNYDRLFGTDDSSRYDETYTVEMYILNAEGFSGDGDFWSQFGDQIRDEIKFSVSVDRFRDEVGIPAGLTRPDEGDLIYFPLYRKCFVVKFVDAKEEFYQLGRLYTYKLTCEVFEYSGEEFNTGDPEIDRISDKSLNAVDWAVLSGGEIVVDDHGNVATEDFDPDTIDPGSVNGVANTDASVVIQGPFDPFASVDEV